MEISLDDMPVSELTKIETEVRDALYYQLSRYFNTIKAAGLIKEETYDEDHEDCVKTSTRNWRFAGYEIDKSSIMLKCEVYAGGGETDQNQTIIPNQYLDDIGGFIKFATDGYAVAEKKRLERKAKKAQDLLDANNQAEKELFSRLKAKYEGVQTLLPGVEIKQFDEFEAPYPEL